MATALPTVPLIAILKIVKNLFSKPVIPVARCPACEAETVLYSSVDEQTGELVRCCAACDGIVSERGAAAIDYYAASELEGTGFAVTEPLSADGGCGGCGEEGCATCDHADTCEKIH